MRLNHSTEEEPRAWNGSRKEKKMKAQDEQTSTSGKTTYKRGLDSKRQPKPKKSHLALLIPQSNR